jgi:succinate dehydrogenase / fumarate reductase cytochrome b subunit
MTTKPQQVRGGGSAAPPVRARPHHSLWFLDFYASAIGKKAVMAVTGIYLLGFVLLHMIGNIKLYEGPDTMDAYASWLRHIGSPFLPTSGFLDIVRAGLIIAFAFHIHAAVTLTRMNRQSGGSKLNRYQGGRTYLAADYAARTMRWSGIIVGAFVLFHLFDLTWGQANPDFVRGAAYYNVVHSMQRWPIATIYIIANLLLGIHIFHGAWSLFQSLGWNPNRFVQWRRWFAVIFAFVIVAGNVSFPIAVLTRVVS